MSNHGEACPFLVPAFLNELPETTKEQCTHLLFRVLVLPDALGLGRDGRGEYITAKTSRDFYEGVEVLKEIYADSLKERKPIHAFWDYENAEKVMGNYLETYYRPERKRRNVFYHGILRDSPTTREILKFDNKAFRENKFIAKGEFTTEINIYGNKVALLSFRTDPPFGVLIEDKDIAETLRTAWQNLWDRLGEIARYENKEN